MQAERLLCPGAAPDFICCNFPNVMDVMERKRAGEKLVRKKKIATIQTGENPLNGFCPVFYFSVFGRITKKSNTNLVVVTRLTFDVYGSL